MMFAEFMAWLPTAVVTALAYLVWRKIDGVDLKLDGLNKVMILEVKAIQLELRAMDVRISRMESSDIAQDKAANAAAIIVAAELAAERLESRKKRDSEPN